jgi:dipeptidyl aminopeptidase/acylaminoacyl peptidase
MLTRLCLLLICALLFPGCMAARLIPVKGPPKDLPAGVELVRFDGGLRVPADPASGRVSLEGRLYPPLNSGDSAAETSGPGAPPAPVVLFCHGVLDNNASPMARWFREAGYRVFMHDYRGFGASDPNAPATVQGLIDDTVATLAYLRARPDVDPSRVLIAGHSMGGTMALAAAAHAEASGQPVRAVVALAAFSNWRIVLADNVGPAGFLFGGTDAQNPSQAAAQLLRTPTLIVHAQDDSIVPVWHAHQLARWNWSAGGRAQLHILPTGEHVGAYLDYPSFRATTLAWLHHHARADFTPDPAASEQTDARLRKAAGR